MNYEFVSIFLFVFSQFIATNRDNLGNLHFFYGLQLVLLAHGSHVLYMTNFLIQDYSNIYDRMEIVSHAPGAWEIFPARWTLRQLIQIRGLIDQSEILGGTL